MSLQAAAGGIGAGVTLAVLAAVAGLLFAFGKVSFGKCSSVSNQAGHDIRRVESDTTSSVSRKQRVLESLTLTIFVADLCRRSRGQATSLNCRHARMVFVYASSSSSASRSAQNSGNC
jgi:hypothetical protein